jgi:hypothetical protein
MRIAPVNGDQLVGLTTARQPRRPDARIVPQLFNAAGFTGWFDGAGDSRIADTPVGARPRHAKAMRGARLGSRPDHSWSMHSVRARMLEAPDE